MNVKPQGWHGVVLLDLARRSGKNGVKQCYLIHSRHVDCGQIADPTPFDLNIFHYAKPIRDLHRLIILSVFHDLPTIVPFHRWRDDSTIPTRKRLVNWTLRKSRRELTPNNWLCIFGQFPNVPAPKYSNHRCGLRRHGTRDLYPTRL